MIKKMVIQTRKTIRNLPIIIEITKDNNCINKNKMEQKNSTINLLIKKKSRLNLKINGCLKLLNNKIINLYNKVINSNTTQSQIKMVINKESKI